jgi:hypothetical protein
MSRTVIDERDRVAAMESVATRWNDLKIPWLVAHGLEGYPERIGRDLDILMPQELAPWALGEARQIFMERGWPLTACPPPLWGERLVAVRFIDSSTSYLELHTMKRLRWGFLELGSWKPDATHHLGPFPVHVGLTLSKAVLQPLITGDFRRFSQEYLQNLTLRDDLGAASEHLTSLLGDALTNSLLKACLDCDPAALVATAPELRRACLRGMLLRPKSSLGLLPEFLSKKLGRLRGRGGAYSLLELPETIDIDTAVSPLAEELSRVFLEVRIVPADQRSGALMDRNRVLARQGAFLLVRSDPVLRDTMRLTYHDVSKKFPLTDDDSPVEAAHWIMERWCMEFGCT